MGVLELVVVELKARERDLGVVKERNQALQK